MYEVQCKILMCNVPDSLTSHRISEITATSTIKIKHLTSKIINEALTSVAIEAYSLRNSALRSCTVWNSACNSGVTLCPRRAKTRSAVATALSSR